MSIHTCRFCGKNQDIFTCEVPPDEDNPYGSLFYVCGSCWEAIAEIARRVIHITEMKKETK
jgi:hypothetical protein